MTEPKSKLFKVIFEGVDSTAYFYVNGIDELLSQEYFNRKLKDAKNNETFTLRERIEKQLDNPNT